MKKNPHPLPMKSSGNYYKCLISLATGLTLVFLAVLVWQSWLSYRDFQKLVTIGESINESNALIGQLDEALTMSARMAAATGDRKWEDRYLLLEPQLDAAIRKVKALAPDLAATKGAQKTDDANQVLVEMEYRSFKLIGEGRQDAARALLSSPEYEAAKHIYANGLQQIRISLSERSSSFLQVAQNRLTLTLIFMGSILPLLLVLWAWVIQTARINSATRIATEKALNESQKQYFNLVEGTPNLVTRVTADGRFLFVNHAAQEIYGLSSEECIGRPAFDFIHPEDRVATEAALQFWLKSDADVFAYENRMVGIDGRIHYLAWSIRPEHDENGNISGFASTARDITERMRLEAEKKKLEVINRQIQKTESLGRMSGAIAHIFNNQLQVVLGYLEIVIGELAPGDSRIAKLAKAMQATKKASEVSGYLLAYLGQKQVEPEVLDLSELCRKSLPILQAGKPESIALETDLPSPGPCIMADAKQIQQILTNLVINAWEAIGDGPEKIKTASKGAGGPIGARNAGTLAGIGRGRGAGNINLSVKTVSQADIPKSHRFPVDWHVQEQHYVCLEIADSGCGIQEEDMDKLFDPFFSTKFTGRGLGLPVVLGIVRAHGVLITVENRIGGGSVFSVFFPLSAQTAPPRIEHVAEIPQVFTGGIVLVVEDEEEVRKMAARMLINLGLTVFQAKDGVEAVEIFRQHKDEISCILTDLTMPRMDGWETIDALRAVKPDLPVILASGYDEFTAMEGDHPNQPDVFLNKPYGVRILKDAIGKAMTRKAMDCKKMI